jgi:ubiquinone biosynthesis protein COQ4
MTSSTSSDSRRDRPARFALLRSFLAIARDPEETSHGARLVITIDRHQMERNFQRFADAPEGARILSGAPSLYDLLTDRASLGALPEGSLGRTYLEFMQREGISTEALDAEVAPVELEILGADPDRRRFHQHMRASHDLWHVLTGYHRDLFGEMQVLVFSHSQTGSRAFGWIARMARFGAARQIPGGRQLLELARKRGESSQWLAAVAWAPLLAEPIDDVRRCLGIGPPPSYTRYVRAASGFGLVPEEQAALPN